MNIFWDTLGNFFTHKDFLPDASKVAGTLFSPLQIIFCTACALLIAHCCRKCSRWEEGRLKRLFLILWAITVLSEPIIDIYDSLCGKEAFFDLKTSLPFWHCSIFMYTLPFAVFSKGKIRQSACGYICTLGLLGGAINFIYPASYLSYYSCISFAGFRTIFYHGAMVFVGVTMLLSGYHSFKTEGKLSELLLPSIPALIVSVPANIINFTVLGADYMFFKMESFFFAPIGRLTPDWLTLILSYIILLLIHALPYLPSYFSKRKQNVDDEKEKELIIGGIKNAK